MQKRISRREFMKVAGAAAATGVLAACGPAGTPAPTATPPQATPTPVPSTPTPKEAVTLVVSRPEQYHLSVYSGWIANEAKQNHYMVYDGLMQLNDDFEMVPDLATSWEADPNFKDYTFNLREGVRFHDGTPFNAEALKFHLDGILACGKLGLGAWIDSASKDSVEVVSDYVVKIHLTKPVVYFATADLVLPVYLPISPTAIQANATADDPYALAWQATHGVGTGPFVLKEWVQDQKTVFEKNQDYWGGFAGAKTTPYVDKLVYQIIGDPDVARLELENGNVDIAEGLTYEQLDALKGVAGVKVLSFAIPKDIYFTFDVGKPPFDDVNVRKAIGYAINYEELLEFGERGYSVRLRGLIPKGILYYDDTIPRFEYDLAKAKDYMSRSGYANGFETDLLYAPERHQGFDEEVELLQQYLAEIGIVANIQSMTFTAQRSKEAEREYGIGLHAWNSALPDPDDMIGWMYDYQRLEPYESTVFSWWDDEIAMQNVRLANQVGDPTERARLYREASMRDWEQAIYIPLYQAGIGFAMRENIEGFLYHTNRAANYWAVRKT